MGAKVNSEGDRASSPYVSPDGKYFFFGSSRKVDEAMTDRFNLQYLAEASKKPGYGSTDTWWIDAGFIDAFRADLKPEDFK